MAVWVDGFAPDLLRPGYGSHPSVFFGQKRRFAMSPELSAQLTIATFSAIALGLVARDIRRDGLGWRLWFLYFLQRTYGAFFFHPRFNKRCPFPDEGPALIIANHRSPVDPLMVWMNHHLAQPSRRIRNIRFMMAREYLDVKGVGWITRVAKVIPASRDGRDSGPAREALRALKQGDLIGLFPEGRINTGVDLLEASPGIAWLALKSQVPVYPVFLQGTPQGGMVDSFCRFSRVRVIYGDPIDLSQFEGRKANQELLREATAVMMQHLAALGGVQAAPSQRPAERSTVPMNSATG